MKILENKEESVSYKGNIKNIGKAIKKLKDNYTHLVIVGSKEENTNKITIQSLDKNEDILIEQFETVKTEEDRDWGER